VIIYLSGIGTEAKGGCFPETLLDKPATVMLSYFHTKEAKNRIDRMKVYMFGKGAPMRKSIECCPEVILKNRAYVMLSYFYMEDGSLVDRADKIRQAAEGNGSAVFESDEVSCTVHRPLSLFLDSGAFSLWRKHQKESKTVDYSFYRNKVFKEYITAYVEFVKTYDGIIDLVANADVVPRSPKEGETAARLSMGNFKLLRRMGLETVPVVHYGTDPKWIGRYQELGCDYVALGGLVGSIKKPGARRWISQCFNQYGDVRFHAFGVSNIEALFAYPWHSVDSAVWDRTSTYGSVLVPKFRGGQFVLSVNPTMVKITTENPSVRDGSGSHYLSMSKAEQAIILRWLDEIGVSMGGGEQAGVSTCYRIRRIANLRYFERLQNFLDTMAPPQVKPVKQGFLG